MTTIPGLKAKHAIITPACRQNRGDEGAMEAALDRVRNEYIAILDVRRDNPTFHVVLTIEDMMRAIAAERLKRGAFVFCSTVPDEKGETLVYLAPPPSGRWPSNSIGFTLTRDYAKGEEVHLPF